MNVHRPASGPLKGPLKASCLPLPVSQSEVPMVAPPSSLLPASSMSLTSAVLSGELWLTCG